MQCGFPVFGVGNQGFMYPINLILFFCLPAHIAYNLNYVIHFILAGIFTYFFAKEIGLSKTAALISSIIFIFSGFLIGHLEHMDILNSAIWMPLILIFIEKILRGDEKRYIYVILAGIFIGIQILAGHQQITFYSLLCIALYFFFGVLYEHRKRILKFALIFGLLIIIGIGISAIQTIPTYELLSLSNRGGGINLKFANIGVFPPENFITFILPYFFGDNENYWGRWSFIESCVYTGILPLILLLFGICLKKNRYIYFFLFLILLSAILMVGSYTPLYTMLWHLPIFNSVRAPARFAYLMTFSIAIISGFGISNLIGFNYNKKIVSNILFGFLILIVVCWGIISIMGIEKLLPQRFSLDMIEYIQQDVYILFVFLCISIAMLLLWTKQKLGSVTFKFLILTFIIIDLFLFSLRALPPTIKMRKLQSIVIPQIAEFLLQDKDIYRIMSIYPGSVSIFSKEKDLDIAFSNLLSPAFNICSNIQHINMICGLVCVEYWQEAISVFRKGTPEHIKQDKIIPLFIKNLQLLNLFNVKYILFPLDINDNRFRTVFEDNGIKIIENKQILSRAFVVHNVKVIKEKEKVFEELSSKGFNPRQYVILDEYPQANVNSNSTASSTAKIVNYGNEEVAIHCSMKDNGFLVLTDIYYPGWQVYIDNKKGKIYRAYHTFRAVYLEKGNHIVRFKYEPLSFKIGMCISLLTLCGITIFLLFIRPSAHTRIHSNHTH
jgi:uncharacterized membrane protein YfhO